MLIFRPPTCVGHPRGKCVWRVGAESEIGVEKCQEESDWSVINQTLHEASKLFLINPVKTGEERDALWPVVRYISPNFIRHLLEMRFAMIKYSDEGGVTNCLRNSPLAQTALSLQPWGQPMILRSLRGDVMCVAWCDTIYKIFTSRLYPWPCYGWTKYQHPPPIFQSEEYLLSSKK